eukprot:NODE_1459_length_1946_cov_40.151399_g1238_i0.p1 GENE.NODE_1459_length_1946_cov_40.151399_g1238_i0~~NODE_1459_length_1946_cov_40.151399_g1238_i0.p1  ORF type:complete len:482 (+),score=41.33 NODE_1459_length_1946_cov_40.151399_g1238_i0:216-1661(+)
MEFSSSVVQVDAESADPNELVQSKINVELCPLSNLMLRYTPDLRQHYGRVMEAKGDIYRICISNDDPRLFGYSGVGLDWFISAVAMGLDLLQLKKIILDCIEMSLLTKEMKIIKQLEFKKNWTIFITKLQSKLYGNNLLVDNDLEGKMNAEFTNYRNRCYNGGEEEDIIEECTKSSQFSYDIKELQHLTKKCEACKVVYDIVNNMPTTALLHVHSTVLGHNDDLAKQCAIDPNCRVCVKDSCSLRNERRANGSISHTCFIDNIDDGWQRLSIDALRIIAAEKWQLNGHRATIREAWNGFTNLFKYTSSYINVDTVLKQHYYETIIKHYQTTSHLELRVMVGKGGEMYNDKGETLSAVETIDVYREAMEMIRKERDFTMIIIPCSRRSFTVDTIMEAYKAAHNLNMKYPEFVNGFDLVGQETTKSDKNVKEFFLKFRQLPRERQLRLVMHMGERSNKLDQFYVDMLKSYVYRVGHGLALMYH